MKQEEEEVDIDGVDDELVNGNSNDHSRNGEFDEDAVWAGEEPDDDVSGWRLKVIMEDDPADM